MESFSEDPSTSLDKEEEVVVDKGKKTKLLVVILVLVVVTQTSYMNVAALLPAYTAEHHPGISATMNGVLIGVYQATFFFTSAVIGSY